MVAGLGIDIIETDRIAEKINRTSGFKDKVFSANEIAYCESMATPAQHFAARFAAKEALLKALGAGLTFHLDLMDIEITNADSGAPRFTFYAEMAQKMASLGYSNIQVSLSHVQSAACAVVILER